MTDSKAQKEQLFPNPSSRFSSFYNWYSVPPTVRRVFNQFPLVTYQEDQLPQRAQRKGNAHTLFIFANPFDSSEQPLSCNPTCLKWQAYLKFNEIDFAVAASSNHASPSGSLPFLLPASSTPERSLLPLAAGKISRWVSQETMQEEEYIQLEHEAYMTLVDYNIRNAWLYHLYMDKGNFGAVAHPLYVATTSSNAFVQATIARQLREAAQTELLKSHQIIDREELYQAAAEAFKAFSVLLGSDRFFASANGPGLLDASIFAYTHLLLDESLPWVNVSMTSLLRQYPRLIDHRKRLLGICLKS